MNVKIEQSWKEVLQREFEQDYFCNLVAFVKQEYASGTVFPPGNEIFAAFDATPFDRVKVVIIGQDPYHGERQANGLCFSVAEGIQFPPSLLNIFKEIHDDIGTEIPTSGDLTRWAKQGVLLLNATLTVRAHCAGSHQGKGWEIFTDRVIELLNQRQQPMVFILWGNNAKAKEKLITNPNHLIIKSAHPSPLSAHYGFWGGRYFSRTNEFLESTGQEPVDWRIPE